MTKADEADSNNNHFARLNTKIEALVQYLVELRAEQAPKRPSL